LAQIGKILQIYNNSKLISLKYIYANHSNLNVKNIIQDSVPLKNLWTSEWSCN